MKWTGATAGPMVMKTIPLFHRIPAAIPRPLPAVIPATGSRGVRSQPGGIFHRLKSLTILRDPKYRDSFKTVAGAYSELDAWRPGLLHLTPPPPATMPAATWPIISSCSGVAVFIPR